MKISDTAAAAAITVGATVGGFLAITTLVQPAQPAAIELVEPAGVVDVQEALEPVVLPETADLLALTPQTWVSPPATEADGPMVVADAPAAASEGDAGSIDGTEPSDPSTAPPPADEPAPTPPAAQQPSPVPPVEEDRVPEYNARGEPIPFEPPPPLTEPDAPEPEREPDPFAHLDDEDVQGDG